MEFKDMRGIALEKGQRVAYGKSCRWNPVNLGVIVEIQDREVHIKGDGNVRVGKIPSFHTNRILVLPDDY